jgi:hypothetical protein
MWGQVARYSIYALYTPILIQIMREVTNSLAQEGISRVNKFKSWALTCECHICQQRRSLGLNTFH